MRRGREVFITQITDPGLVMQYCQRDIHLYMENELHVQFKFGFCFIIWCMGS
jgi:hypothetical protein